MKRRLSILLCAALMGCGAKTLDVGQSGAGGCSGAGGSTPVDGTHSTVLIPRLSNPFPLGLEGDYLYWMFAEPVPEIARCVKNDCRGTRQTLLQVEKLASLLVHKETLYFSWQGSIASCPASGCKTPQMLVREGLGRLLAVDDAGIFWMSQRDNAILSCPLTGCERATAAPVTGIGRFIAATAVDATHLFWVTSSGMPSNSFSVISAPKDGSSGPKTLVTGLGIPTSLVADAGFVYWANTESEGVIARCPTAGCTDGVAEVIASKQYFPQSLTASAGALFWLNEVDPVEKLMQVNRPAKVVGCAAASCAESVEVLDESRAGSLIPPPYYYVNRAQQMVADAEAVYWFGDVVGVNSPDGSASGFEASIRRLPRKPGK